jgi:GT2 family glycosyltransferase
VISAIICAFGDQPHLHAAVDALRASRAEVVEVVVVDNGSPDCAGLPADVRVVVPGSNLGFAGGCNRGARQARGDVLVFVNSDALVEPDCLARLARRAVTSGGLVGATVVLAEEPDRVNSWGNPVQILGFSWAGGYGHPVEEARGGPVASVSGAVFAVQRSVFWELGGMDDAYFAYGEDVDLSLRAHLQGRPVEVLADARAHHHYEFGRNPAKMYLLERNRLITVLTTYRPRTLIALTPLLLAAEAALLVRSGREQWAGQKVAGWRWLVSHRRYLRRRRNRLQGTRQVPDARLLGHLTVAIDPPDRFGMSVSPRAQDLIAGYWDRVGRRVAGGH